MAGCWECIPSLAQQGVLGDLPPDMPRDSDFFLQTRLRYLRVEIDLIYTLWCDPRCVCISHCICFMIWHRHRIDNLCRLVLDGTESAVVEAGINDHVIGKSRHPMLLNSVLYFHNTFFCVDGTGWPIAVGATWRSNNSGLWPLGRTNPSWLTQRRRCLLFASFICFTSQLNLLDNANSLYVDKIVHVSRRH